LEQILCVRIGRLPLSIPRHGGNPRLLFSFANAFALIRFDLPTHQLGFAQGGVSTLSFEGTDFSRRSSIAGGQRGTRSALVTIGNQLLCEGDRER